MKVFKLHWKTGEIQTVRGEDIYKAMDNAGIGQGALPALDYWEEVNELVQKADHG